MGRITVPANNVLLAGTPSGPFQDPSRTLIYGTIMEGLINIEDYALKVYANTSQMSIGAGWPRLWVLAF